MTDRWETCTTDLAREAQRALANEVRIQRLHEGALQKVPPKAVKVASSQEEYIDKTSVKSSMIEIL
jgi:hypothetical protein